MPDKFSILNQDKNGNTRFLGYMTKSDAINTPPGFLTEGSQNVLINQEEKIAIRGGYTLFGAADTTANAIDSAYDWLNSSGTKIALRKFNTTLQFYDANVGAWTSFVDTFSTNQMQFDGSYWDNTEIIDLLLFVNGTDNMYDWSGAITTLKSATANTLTKNGATTWAQERFLQNGARKVTINGTEYTYTGGENTTTLTGVTPNPSGEAAGSTVFQSIRINVNTPAANFFSTDIRVLNNRVWVVSDTSQLVYVSKNTDFTDYTFSSPRVAGEGNLIRIDSRGIALEVLDNGMMIFSGEDDIYKSKQQTIDVGGTLTEAESLDKLKTSSGQSAQSPNLVTKIGDMVAWISHEPVLRIIGSQPNLENPQMVNLSDPIKPDFDNATFTNGHIKFHKQRIYISLPNDGEVFINELLVDAQGRERRLWQPPQILPVRMFAVISGDIYGHSNTVQETYKLFDGTDDNDGSFKALAYLSYRSFADRVSQKNFDEYYVEGSISGNTSLKVTFRYDSGGASGEVENTIDGSDSDILFESTQSGSLGDNPLGDAPLGDYPNAVTTDLVHFETIIEAAKVDCSKFQIIFETDDIDQQWTLLAIGPNAKMSGSINTTIKK